MSNLNKDISVKTKILSKNQPAGLFFFFKTTKKVVDSTTQEIVLTCYKCDPKKLERSFPEDFKVWFEQKFYIENNDFSVLEDFVLWFLTSLTVCSALSNPATPQETKNQLSQIKTEMISIYDFINFDDVSYFFTPLSNKTNFETVFLGEASIELTKIYYKIVQQLVALSSIK